MADGETLSAFLDDIAARFGEAPALLYGGRRLSYAELADAAERVAGGLRRIGIRPGDPVALWLPNVPAYVILVFALARLGAVSVAVNTRFRGMEVEDIVGRSGARALVMWPGFKGIDFDGILAQVNPARLASVETVIVYDETGEASGRVIGRRTVSFQDLLRAEAERAEHATPETPVAMFTTSGTTKAPKFVLHGHAGIVRHARDVAAAFGLDRPGAVTMGALPLCGVFGFCQTMAALAGGGTTVVHPVFDPEAVAEAIRVHSVTHMMGTDTMFSGMLAARPEPRPFPTLKLCGFAAFTGLDRFLAECERRRLPMVGLYGMSEVQALFSAQRVEDPLERRGEGGGYPVSRDAQVRVCDPETGEVLPTGTSGELQFRAPSLMLRYEGNTEATAEAFTPDGWFRSGDAGRLREDGSFVFEARMGDVLRLAGFLTSPAEIEAWIERHPDVAEAQVVGVTTGKGLRPFAFVIPHPGRALDEATLVEHCREGMANYKVPVRFVLVEAFPVTESANAVKIQRHRLREMAEEMLAELEPD